MKLKNATFVEMHLEKVVIGTAVVVSLAIILLFVLRRPTVEINGQTVGPAKVDEQVLVFARQLEQKLNQDVGIVDPETNQPLEIKASTLSNDFAQLRNIDPTWAALVPVSFGVPGEPVTGGIPDRPYVVPTPPMPQGIAVAVNSGTLDLYQSEDIEQAYVDLYQWGIDEPRDIVGGVTVSAVFDATEWKRRIESTTGGTQMTGAMQRQAERIAGVLLLRQTLDPITGEWGDDTVVSSAPEQVAYGAYALRTAAGIPGEFFDPEVVLLEDSEAREISGSLVVQKTAVTQAPAPILVKGTWRMPGGEDAKELAEEDYAQIDKIRDTVEKKQKLLEQSETQYEQYQRREQLRQERERRSSSTASRRSSIPAGPPGGFDGDMAAEMEAGVASRPRSRAPQDRGQELQERIRVLESEIDDALQEVMVLMGWQDEQEDPFALRQSSDQPEIQRVVVGPGAREVVDEKVDVWAHDLTVVPGYTYRYKIVVVPLNPLFRNVAVPEPQKSENYNRIGLSPNASELQASPWSSEVVVNDDSYFFYTAGSSSQQTARFEVWRFYDGQWRSGEIETGQGDQLAGIIEYEIESDDSLQSIRGVSRSSRSANDPIVIRVFELPIDAGAIFLEMAEHSLESTGQQISQVRYLNQVGDLQTRTLEDDRSSLQRRKLNSLQWLASEPRLQQGSAALRRSGMMDDPFGGMDPGAMIEMEMMGLDF